MSKQFGIVLSVLICAALIWGSAFSGYSTSNVTRAAGVTSTTGLTRTAGQDASGSVPDLTSYQILLKGQPVDSLLPGAKAKRYRIVLTGSAFTAGTVANINGTDVNTSFDSDTQLT